MLAIFGAIKEVFGFMTTLTDADQRKKKYEIYLDKRAKRALHYAERIIELVDSHEQGELSDAKFKQSYKWYKKQFNLYD